MTNKNKRNLIWHHHPPDLPLPVTTDLEDGWDVNV
jgi:hypothetical protein